MIVFDRLRDLEIRDLGLRDLEGASGCLDRSDKRGSKRCPRGDPRVSRPQTHEAPGRLLRLIVNLER